MQYYTTIEQSKKLVELGLNPDTADMLWEQHSFENPYVTVKPYTTKGKSIDAHILPCWSLGALLKLMPTSIEEVKDHKVDLILGHPKDKWCLAYFDWTGLQQGPSTTSNIPLKAVYDMVIWLLKNGYIKKGE